MLKVFRLAKKQKALLQACSRSLASAEPAVAEESSFLRFGSILPKPTNYTPVLAGAPQTRVTTLSNGLKVATETQPFARTATVGVWIDAGSRFETGDTNGTAHFLEHMAFKGTKSRTTKSLEVEVENMGGHLNAYTSRESTCYFAKVMEPDVGKAVDILSDIMQNPVFDDAAIERERGVILREMEEIEKQTEEVLFDHLHATAFQSTPLGRTILGPAENIRTITRQDLLDYIATHYTGSRMVLAAAGAIEHDAMVKMAEAKFAKLPMSQTSAAELVVKDPTAFTGSEVRIRNPDDPLVHLAVAYQGASWNDPDCVPLMVMQTMLGSWNKRSGVGASGPTQLSQRSAANELCESYNAFNTNYHDTGLFGLYAISTKEKLQDLAWAMMQEMTKMCYNVSEDDVIRGRNHLKTQLTFQAEGTTGAAEDIGRQMLVHGRRIPKAEMFARIDAVDAATVREVADRFLYDQELAITAIGDTQELPDYNWMRRNTYWLRY